MAVTLERGGKTSQQLSGGGIHTPESIAKGLREALRSPEFQPAILPSTALELVELSRDPEVPLSKVRDLIETEPMLAVALLRTANSPFYSRGNPVDSIDDALLRLGVQRVAGIFLETAMKATALTGKTFQSELDELRRHMTATGHIARGVSRALKRPGERAFVCGLLHDIGWAGCLMVLADLPRKERPKSFETIREAVNSVHEEGSAVMGAKWNLPWGIQWVVGHHHNFWVDGRISPMAALISLSDWLASEAGAPAMAESDEKTAHEAMDYFEFSGAARSKLQDRCKRIVEQLA